MTINFELLAEHVAVWLWEQHNESVHMGWLAEGLELFFDLAVVNDD
jgi:hypothetical protein